MFIVFGRTGGSYGAGTPRTSAFEVCRGNGNHLVFLRGVRVGVAASQQECTQKYQEGKSHNRLPSFGFACTVSPSLYLLQVRLLSLLFLGNLLCFFVMSHFPHVLSNP